jgi:fatty acid/phospholipid biosynthesis enzyme
MGAIFAEEILELAKPEVRLLSIGEEPEKGNQLTSRRTRSSRDASSTSRQRREPRPARRRRRRRRLRRLHRQRRAEAARGDDHDLLDALRDEISRTPRGKLGGLLIRPAARRLRSRLDRRPTAAPTCSASAGSP